MEHHLNRLLVYCLMVDIYVHTNKPFVFLPFSPKVWTNSTTSPSWSFSFEHSR